MRERVPAAAIGRSRGIAVGLALRPARGNAVGLARFVSAADFAGDDVVVVRADADSTHFIFDNSPAAPPGTESVECRYFVVFWRGFYTGGDLAVSRCARAIRAAARTIGAIAGWLGRADRREISDGSAAAGERFEFVVGASRADRAAGAGESGRPRARIEDSAGGAGARGGAIGGRWAARECGDDRRASRADAAAGGLSIDAGARDFGGECCECAVRCAGVGGRAGADAGEIVRRARTEN